MIFDKDTICALSSAPGGALGVIRVSGDDAINFTNKVFSKDLTNVKPDTLHYGEIIGADGGTVDEVVVSVWRNPHSYTGENVTEISCHGSRYIIQNVIKALIDAGCRQAKPGEFTQRAYLNGKMDLSQAEAVADLIASTNEAQHKLAMSQLKGGFSKELDELRGQLLKMTSLLELELDFSDHEDLEFADRSEINSLAEEIDNRIVSLAKSFKAGKVLKSGIPVAIVGKTNVGKSTLLNALLGEERAIVSDIDGTTRDTIEDTTTIDGVLFRFIDTAGLRKTTDQIENIGISRALNAVENAYVVLWVIDSQPSDEDIKRMQSLSAGKYLFAVFNKADLPHETPTLPVEIPSVEISAKKGTGVATLGQTIVNSLDLPSLSSADVVVTNARHHADLMRAHDHLQRVITGLASALPSDLLAEDLRLVIDDLADITGQDRITPQETLNNIFQHFCIGK
ncbi:MAG: tRNA uridine-5-carboxymethylaminomethyl(34) synthesis GTPase MnmE [Prevotella sp.]|nr:tRNA uridine-5-carboxymethylaminomethyl(34) synthesis GTPase MnmE [Prevotella sp.]